MAIPDFKDPAFWRMQIHAFMNKNPQFYSKQNQEKLEKEFLNFIDYYKIAVECFAKHIN